MRDPVFLKRVLAIAVAVVVVSVGVIWFAPLSEIRFTLSNPEYESVAVGVFVDASGCELGDEDLIVELGPQETVSKGCSVRAGTHEIRCAWKSGSDDPSEPYPYATVHPLYVKVGLLGTEDVELTVFLA